ncbi:MAG: YraN family protein [Nesterenkonia sp.]|uniref:YraN family protein n=1 Tax=Nesterenkonia marinintestina TaxID=2979865 RepID=UPI0021BFDD67|nr:YraN family protein [Nesterenkonia sp. GX14115]MDO5492049.1 YraN family protein [Nesterenkonia sp.]
MRAKDRTGLIGEELAADHLRRAGHHVMEQRWRCRRGELDLITFDEDVLVAVEVKTRRGRGYGHPAESISPEKLRRLHLLLADYAVHSGAGRRRRRVDVVSVILGPAGAEHHGAPVIDHLEDVRR